MILLSLLLALNVNADTFKLNYNYKNTKLMVITDAADYPEAIDKGAGKCMSFYFKMFSVLNMNEDDKLDLVDACTNPRK